MRSKQNIHQAAMGKRRKRVKLSGKLLLGQQGVGKTDGYRSPEALTSLPTPHLNTFLSIFYEPDGKLSFARIASTVVLALWLSWVSFIVFSTRALPSGTWEVSPVILALYSVNKVASAIAGTPDKN